MRGFPKLKIHFEYEKQKTEKPIKILKAHKNKTLQQTVASLNQRISQENTGVTSYNSLVDQYMTPFLKVYYSPSSADFDTRTKEPTQYLVSDLTLLSTNKNTVLKLVSSTLHREEDQWILIML
ncbi:hypothetical protein [Leuconostoc suionicum]|uniref:hypothetical protein n=1 Tax=Leuconostoc suionicum TaxID=1511761 RepID=UPI0024ADF621|nr:hypothetical protein [Leuconostoc suionicum]MDI6681892.1 hypothetical protein [Leuconostoc suionicum]